MAQGHFGRIAVFDHHFAHALTQKVCGSQTAAGMLGSADATVNFMALKMNVEFEEGADEKKVLKKALKNARKVDDDIEIEF